MTTPFQQSARAFKTFEGISPWKILATRSYWVWDNWYEDEGMGRPYHTRRKWRYGDRGSAWAGPGMVWLKVLARRYMKPKQETTA